jgi:DNA-directed RNA polymerase subunit H (RpoH/RPB5)
MESTSLQDILIRSRSTILDLLEDRGYNTQPYRKLNGPDLAKLVNNPESLRMDLVKRDDATHKCIVYYCLTKSIKTSVGSGDFVKKMLAEEPSDTISAPTNVDPKTTEVIILFVTRQSITTEDMETYDRGALEAWNKHGLKLSFFPMSRLVNNPLKHMLQPKFEIVPHDQHDALLKELCARSKTQLPIIRFHNDMAARCLGLMPLDIVKITAPSPTAGQYIKYRVCA